MTLCEVWPDLKSVLSDPMAPLS